MTSSAATLLPPRIGSDGLRYSRVFSQTYRQLANVLAESGEDTDATQVRIAAEDLRYSHYGPLGRIWGAFLKYTIGYGHRPMLTLMWSLAVMLLGWAVV